MTGLGSIALAAGCTSVGSSGPLGSDPGDGSRDDGAVQTITYGDDPSQFLELTVPTSGESRGVVVVIHGGFWRAEYDLSLGRPLAADLARRGWTAVNLEYRRVGGGGGFPETFDDVRDGIDALADIADLDTTRVVTLGHSAGGHLAVWVAGQTTRVPVTGAISQAGVVDLGLSIEQDLGSGATLALIGSPDRLPETDPMAAIPLSVPVRCVHGRSDKLVPLSQSQSYVDAAVAAGADATLTEVGGGHFVIIDPATEAWATTVDVITDLTR